MGLGAKRPFQILSPLLSAYTNQVVTVGAEKTLFKRAFTKCLLKLTSR
jgi:hypothetical protein